MFKINTLRNAPPFNFAIHRRSNTFKRNIFTPITHRKVDITKPTATYAAFYRISFQRLFATLKSKTHDYLTCRAVARALEGGFDVCIVDTAGRLQTQSNLMQELGKIRRVIAKQIPDAPHETLLVIDSTAGQNALSQAKGFKEAAGCTGIVLAKLDGSARGGVIVPVAEQFGLPV